MGYPSLSLRFAFVLSLSLAASHSHSSSSPFHLTRTASSPVPSSLPNLKASASDVVALLGTRQEASLIDVKEARQIRSCFKFLVPFSPNSIRSASGSWSIRRRLWSKEGDGRCHREENELVWWPPEPVLELARLAVDSGGDPSAIHQTLDPSIMLVSFFLWYFLKPNTQIRVLLKACSTCTNNDLNKSNSFWYKE